MKAVKFYGKVYQVPSETQYIAYNYYGEVIAMAGDIIKLNFKTWDVEHYSMSSYMLYVLIDERDDLDKSTWHGSLTKV